MAEEELAELTALRRGRVRLAAYPSAAATLVPRAVAGLRERHPEIDVELTEAEPPEALHLLGSGDADLALVFSYDDPPHETASGGRFAQRTRASAGTPEKRAAAAGETGLAWLPLGEEPVVLVVADGHPAAHRRGLALSDLADEPWIVGCERCREHAVQVCAEAGFEPAVRHVSDDYVVVQNLVAVGLGVTLLPQSAIQAYRHPGVRLRKDASFGTRSFGIVYREGAERVPATAALVRELAA
jgi:DNA-binding transcriptional LysR family regulator